MSQTQDLISQIKQITIEICDIKERRELKSYFNNDTNTNMTTRHHDRREAHKKSDLPPLSGEEGDDRSKHYDYSKRIYHPQHNSCCIQGHCAPTQCPSPAKSTAWLPPHPEHHPSSPDNETPEVKTSRSSPWSGELNDPESPDGAASNVGKEDDPP